MLLTCIAGGAYTTPMESSTVLLLSLQVWASYALVAPDDGRLIYLLEYINQPRRIGNANKKLLLTSLKNTSSPEECISHPASGMPVLQILSLWRSKVSLFLCPGPAIWNYLHPLSSPLHHRFGNSEPRASFPKPYLITSICR